MPKSKEVDAWFRTCTNPLKDVMLAVRDTILAADDRLTECIKWQTPTFVFEGNLASFNPRSKQHVSLLFHTGAEIPGDHPRLEGGGDTARYLKITDRADAEQARPDLEAIVAAWCDLKAGSGPKTARAAKTTKSAKTTAAKKTAKKKSAKKTAKKPAEKETTAKSKPSKSRAAKSRTR